MFADRNKPRLHAEQSFVFTGREPLRLTDEQYLRIVKQFLNQIWQDCQPPIGQPKCKEFLYMARQIDLQLREEREQFFPMSCRTVRRRRH